MMIIIDLTPARGKVPLTLHRQEDVWTINEVTFDFGPLPEGAVLPRAAVSCAALASDITRVDSAIRLTLILPHGSHASDETRWPAPIIDPADGVIPLPAYDDETDPMIVRLGPYAVGMIDWSQMQTAEVQSQSALIEERARMECAKMQGVLALGEQRWNAVLAYGAQAPWAQQVIINSSGNWTRNSQNIAFFAYLLNLSDTEVDDLFRTAMEILP